MELSRNIRGFGENGYFLNLQCAILRILRIFTIVFFWNINHYYFSRVDKRQSRGRSKRTSLPKSLPSLPPPAWFFISTEDHDTNFGARHFENCVQCEVSKNVWKEFLRILRITQDLLKIPGDILEYFRNPAVSIFRLVRIAQLRGNSSALLVLASTGGRNVIGSSSQKLLSAFFKALICSAIFSRSWFHTGATCW